MGSIRRRTIVYVPARTSSPILVGRDDDVATLTAAFDASAAGAPRFVIIRGEAGIGKSRLVLEATNAARSDGTLVLVGECLDIGVAGLPYLPIAETLRGLARVLTPETLAAVLGPGRRDLAALVPELATDAVDPGADQPPPPQLASGLGQARLFERVLGLVGALSERAPTVLVIEDVHWIDRATRDLLTFLSRNLTDERLAIVLTCRVEDPAWAPDLAWLPRSSAPGRRCSSSSAGSTGAPWSASCE
jgi:predicted ATPase